MNTQKKISKGSKSKTRNTRSSTKTNLCGLPSLLPLNTLPTKKETIYFFELTQTSTEAILLQLHALTIIEPRVVESILTNKY